MRIYRVSAVCGARCQLLNSVISFNPGPGPCEWVVCPSVTEKETEAQRVGKLTAGPMAVRRSGPSVWVSGSQIHALRPPKPLHGRKPAWLQVHGAPLRAGVTLTSQEGFLLEVTLTLQTVSSPHNLLKSTGDRSPGLSPSDLEVARYL